MKKGILSIALVFALIAALLVPSSAVSNAKEPILSAAAQQKLQQAYDVKAQLLATQTTARAAAAAVTDWAGLVNAVENSSDSVIRIANDIQMQRELNINRSMVFMSTSGAEITLFSNNDEHMNITMTGSVYLIFEAVILNGNDQRGGLRGSLQELNVVGLTVQNINNNALSVPSESLFLSSSTFNDVFSVSASSNNLVLYDCDITNSRLYLNSSVLEIYMSDFTNTKIVLNATTVFIRGTRFIGNGKLIAEYDGVEIRSTTCMISECEFKEHAGFGLLIQDCSEVSISDSNIIDNGLPHFDLDYGSGLYLEMCKNVDIINCLISNNKTRNGAGIKLFFTEEIVIEGSIISDNNACGIVDLCDARKIILLNDSIVSGHPYGGIASNGDVIVDGSTVESNGYYYDENDEMVIAAWSGGGISAANVTLQNGANVTDNYASLDGGGIYCLGDVALNRSNVDYNIAERNGGGIYTQGTFSLNSTSYVRSNDAGANGGGVYIAGAPYTIANQTRITRNTPDQVYFGS